MKKNSITTNADHKTNVLYTPERGASTPLTTHEWIQAKRVHVPDILTEKEMKELANCAGKIFLKSQF